MAKRQSKRYSINILNESKLVEIDFLGTSVPFDSLQEALTEVRDYISKGYRIKIKGYFIHESKTLKAFLFALSLVGYEKIIVFENKSRYSKSVRRELRRRAIELKKMGWTPKQISEELNIPVKTVYRWLKG